MPSAAFEDEHVLGSRSRALAAGNSRLTASEDTTVDAAAAKIANLLVSASEQGTSANGSTGGGSAATVSGRNSLSASEALEESKQWLCFEDTEEGEAAAFDAGLTEVFDGLVVESDSEGEKPQPENLSSVEVPSISDIGKLFAPLEELAANCESGKAGEFIRQARSEFVSARIRASRKRNGRARQRFIGEFFKMQ